MAHARSAEVPDDLLSAADPSLASTIKSFWGLLKDESATLCSAFLGEAMIFHLLRQYGVVHARGLEGSPVDGALMWSRGDEDIPALPLEAYDNIGDWSKRHGIEFVPFDVKYLSLTPSKSRSLDYIHNKHVYNWRRRGDQPAEFFIVVFEGVFDSLGIVPRETWLRARGASRGTWALTDGVPLWAKPFMVAVDDLREACESMIEAARHGRPYTNPTTRLECSLFKPDSTTTPALYETQHPAFSASNAAYLKLWNQLRSMPSAEYRVRSNALAPFFFDFMVDMPPPIGSLRFEHKQTIVEDPKQNINFHGGRGLLSPFADLRAWHVFWMDAPYGIVCITKDEVSPTWATSGVPRDAIESHTFPSIDGALKHIRGHADAARRRADECLQQLDNAEVDIDLLLKSSDRARKQLVSRDIELDAPSKRLDAGLPWLCAMLNHQLRTIGTGLIFPLDPNQPVGNHVYVHYPWKPEDKAAYDESSGRLPHTAYSKELCHGDFTCVMLRLQDHSLKSRDLTGAKYNQDRMFPLMMRGDYWLKPLRSEKDAMPGFIIIGSTAPASLHEIGNHRTSWYLMLPSEFTTMHDYDQYRPMPNPDFKVKGGHMFLAARPDFTKINAPHDVRGGKPFRGDLVAQGINPCRYVVNLEEIAQTLQSIASTDGNVSIPNPQFHTSNRPFDATLYQTDLASVHQLAWDFCFVRRIRNKLVEHEDLLPSLTTVFKARKQDKHDPGAEKDA